MRDPPHGFVLTIATGPTLLSSAVTTHSRELEQARLSGEARVSETRQARAPPAGFREASTT